MEKKQLNQNIEKIYPLSPLQEGMLYHQLLDQESGNYVVQTSLKIYGDFSVELANDSTQLLATKHDVLRTIIPLNRFKRSMQIVLKEKEIEFKHFDFQEYLLEEQQLKIDEFLKTDIERGFDFEHSSNFRVAIIKLSHAEWIMVWSFHHIIIDGWSLSILFRDYLSFYFDLKRGETKERITSSIKKSKGTGLSHGEYIKWLERQDKEKAYKYWDKLLDGYETDAKIDSFMNKAIGGSNISEFHLSFSPSENKVLKEKAASFNVTISTMVESAWGVLLQLYSGSNDVVFGKVVSGRDVSLPGIEESVGLFINTIPSRIKIDVETSCLELLISIQNQGVNSLDYNYCSLVDIQSRTSKGNLINSVYAFENFLINQEILSEQAGLTFEIIKSREQTNYPLTLRANSLKTLQLDMIYDSNLFSEENISRILSQLKKIILYFASNPEALVNSIDIITEEERHKITEVFNTPEINYDNGLNVKEIFEEVVNRYPHKTALVFDDKHISYEELNKKSNQLAHRLLELGVKKEEPIVILSERSLELMIGILATLKAGACYVPIDSTYPTERIDFILDDVDAKVMLCGDVNYCQKKDLLRINLKDRSYYEGNDTNTDTTLKGDNLAYIIYTSGTSGKPKGSLIEHRSIIRLVKDCNYFHFHEGINILQTGSVAFDASTFEYYGSLLNGGTLYLVSQDTLVDVDKLSETIRKNAINTLWMTSTLFNQMLDIRAEMFECLDYLLVGGEKLSDRHIRKFKRMYPKIKIINGYGPTENTTFTTTCEIPDNFQIIPIGKPISGTQVYVMDKDRLCAIGMPGELCITGIGLSRGYLNREELTKEKFVENPFGEGRMYHTGDLVRWMPDGNIDYLGRIDEQVKIRGYRVELKEIEEVLSKQEGIKDSVVIAKKIGEGDKALFTYVVMMEGQELDVLKLKEGLRKVLPEYMVPQYIMDIDKIPLTVNGKIDRRSLPDIEYVREDYVAPRSPVEEIACSVFEEVLSINKVGIKDNFFELGGHSLRAMRVMNLLEERLGKRVELKAIFKTPTPESLSKTIEEMVDINYEPIPNADVQEAYPMSSAQKRLFLINQMDETGLSYNMPLCLAYEGKMDEDKVQNILTELVKRHESLRTSFHFEEGQVVQRIAHESTIILESEEGDKTTLPEKYLEEFVRTFDLGIAPLLRTKIVRTHEGGGYILFDMHHIISDGMSMNIMVKDFCALHEGHELLPLNVQYKDYSQWMKGKNMEKQKNYWLNVHSEEPPVLDFPLDGIRPQIQSFKGDSVKAILGKKQTEELKSFCKREGYTDYMVLLGALMVCLGKYSRQEDIIIGSPVSGRTHHDTEKIVGIFINTLAMRGYPERNKSVKVFLQEVKELCLGAYENQEYAFEELVDNVVRNRDLSRNPLFDVMFTLQNNEDVSFETKDWILGSIKQRPVAKFDLDFIMGYGDGSYHVDLTYGKALFKKESVELLLNHYFHTLEEITLQSQKTIGELSFTKEEEILDILKKFNDTEQIYSKEKTVKELFEEVVRNNSQKIAVVDGSLEMTYKELNNKANHLAKKLRKMGVGPGERVALLTKRSAAMIVGIYAVIKAGGAYVPMDTSYPMERLQYMLEDSKPKVILMGETEAISTDIEVLILEKEMNDGIESENIEGLHNENDLVYVIYTSGTSGKPKGVMVEHRNLINYVEYGKKAYDTGEICAPLFTSISFDLTATTLFLPLCSGGRIVIGQDDVSEIIKEIFESDRYNFAKMTPAHLKIAVQEKPKQLKNLKTLIIGGEELGVSTAQRILNQFGKHIKIHNEYGPTETTVGCCDYVYKELDEENGLSKLLSKGVSIGGPVGNTKIYVMDKDRLCGINVPGELCVTGTGVSRGYLNKEELTKEKFVDNPYGDGVMYRTGDLARWISDGNLEYLGRIDEQVKIRGYRVELKEIEEILRKQDGVEASVVIAKEVTDEEKALFAYVIMKEGQELDVPILTEGLRKVLPEYMIPQHFKDIDKIPLTVNGKIDRRALPDIEYAIEEYVSPRNPVEEVLCNVFAEVLNIKQVSIKDNFFELGGDSIKAIRAVSKTRELGYEISIRDIMILHCVESLAKKVKEIIIQYEQGEVNGPVELTPIQRAFIGWNLVNRNHYNQAVILTSKKSLSEYLLRKTLDSLVQSHDMLRVVLKKDSQIILPMSESKKYTIKVYDCDNWINLEDEIEDECTKLQSTMNLESGPLMKVGLFKTTKGDHLMIAIHHFLIDGVSWRILLGDFLLAYSLAEKGNEIVLPNKTASYKEWSEALEQYSENSKTEDEGKYWEDVYSKIGNIQLQTEIDLPVTNHKYEYLKVDPSISQKLIYESFKAYGTDTNEILLTALMLSIKKWKGIDALTVDLESHGRSDINDTNIHLDRTLGWFTSIYPIYLQSHGTLRKSLVETKEMLRRVPNLGIGYGIWKYKKNKERTLMPSIAFNYMGDINIDTNEGDSFIISSMKPGLTIGKENELPYDISVDMQMSAGILEGYVNYREGKFKKDSIKKFCNLYIESLTEIIEHCLNQEETVVTPSDFDALDMDVQELDDIMDIFS